MRVKVTFIICIIVLVWGLNKVDYITNAYLGSPGYGLADSIKTDIENLLKKKFKKINKKC